MQTLEIKQFENYNEEIKIYTNINHDLYSLDWGLKPNKCNFVNDNERIAM